MSMSSVSKPSDIWKVREISTDGKERLSISLDYDEDPKDMFPVLLVVPETDKFDHHHLHLTLEGAKSLHAWLGDYLSSKEGDSDAEGHKETGSRKG